MSDSTDFWDAVVVGAGIAGGATAAMLAQRGWRVLLVERSVWPREKVCGGCLSASAINALHEIGVDSAIGRAEPTTSVVWQAGARTFEHSTSARGRHPARRFRRLHRIRGRSSRMSVHVRLFGVAASDIFQRFMPGIEIESWPSNDRSAHRHRHRLRRHWRRPAGRRALGEMDDFARIAYRSGRDISILLGFGFTGPHLHVHGE